MCVSQSWRDGSITEFADRQLCHLEWLRLRARRRLQPLDTTLRHCLCFNIYGLSLNSVNQNHGCQNNVPQRKKNRKAV
jgi:hypothetical protein